MNEEAGHQRDEIDGKDGENERKGIAEQINAIEKGANGQQKIARTLQFSMQIEKIFIYYL